MTDPTAASAGEGRLHGAWRRKHTVEGVLALLDKLDEWLRVPDHAEHFSRNELIGWLNSRPCHTPGIARAILATTQAKLEDVEAENEDLRLIADENADNVRVLDSISDFLGTSHDEELTLQHVVDAFRAAREPQEGGA